MKPTDIVPPQHSELRNVLKRAELKYIMGYDVVEGTALFLGGSSY